MSQLPLFATPSRSRRPRASSLDLWQAAEAFVAGTPPERAAGLAGLLAFGPPGYSRLHLHLFASRLNEPDLRLRHAIVGALSAALEDAHAVPGLRDYLLELLARFGLAQLEWIVEALAGMQGSHLPAARLLSYAPGAGEHLARVAADLRKDGRVRAVAAIMIGEVGYVDAVPALVSLEARLEGRMAGQMPMSFAPKDDPAAEVVLEAVKAALEVLREVD